MLAQAHPRVANIPHPRQQQISNESSILTQLVSTTTPTTIPTIVPNGIGGVAVRKKGKESSNKECWYAKWTCDICSL